jgi:hypothetical protein
LTTLVTPALYPVVPALDVGLAVLLPPLLLLLLLLPLLLHATSVKAAAPSAARAKVLRLLIR